MDQEKMSISSPDEGRKASAPFERPVVHKGKPPTPDSPQKGPNNDRSRFITFAIVTLAFFVVLQFLVFPEIELKRLAYSEFFDTVARNSESHEIVSCEMVENVIRGKLSNGAYFQVNVPFNDPELIPLLRKNVKDFSVNPPKIFWRNVIYSLLPVIFLVTFFWFFLYRGVQGTGRSILSFGKSRARQQTKDKNRINFNDVAGVEEAKEELQEIIEFLKDPKKFQRLGGRIPKGVLLMGPPGTGKTLLAKAVAGEANVPFFSISGSDFVEMFVGVGASRVRDLFEQGKKAAKVSERGSIIFIDELDAVGRQRFAGIGGGHDEREQTLNALLVEMDGFDTQEGVILLASTNRPDVLDPALLRPGRFDRQIVVDRPDLKGREAILQVHCRNVKLSPNINLTRIAQQTSGFSGADLANLVNEAALLAARRDKEFVTQEELEQSIERVMAGPERKSRVINDKEKEIVAVHESGHALCALYTHSADPLHKVSIIPRGTAALGYTLQRPLEDRYLMSENDLLDKMVVMMGGRAAEELTFGEITTGAANDIEVATEFAQRMVCEFGMSKTLGNVTFGKKDRQVFLGRDLMRDKDYSEQTAVLIDREVKSLIDRCYEVAKKLLQEHLDQLKLLSKTLREKETLDGDEVRRLLDFERSI